MLPDLKTDPMKNNIGHPEDPPTARQMQNKVKAVHKAFMQAVKPGGSAAKPEPQDKENVGEVRTPAAAKKTGPPGFRHNLTPPSTGYVVPMCIPGSWQDPLKAAS